MNYEIRHFDTPLLRFSATEDSSCPEIEVLWQNTEKDNLRHLLTFQFKKHSRYNLPDPCLKLIERQIRQRARELLSE